MEKITKLFNVILSNNVSREQLRLLAAELDALKLKDKPSFLDLMETFDLFLNDNKVVLVFPYNRDKAELTYFAFNDDEVLLKAASPASDIHYVDTVKIDIVLKCLLEQYEKIKPKKNELHELIKRAQEGNPVPSPLTPYPKNTKPTCTVCNLDPSFTHYACMNEKCPTRITC